MPLHHNHRVIYLRGVSLRVGDLTLAQFGDKHRKLALEPSERSELVFRCNEVRAARGVVRAMSRLIVARPRRRGGVRHQHEPPARRKPRERGP